MNERKLRFAEVHEGRFRNDLEHSMRYKHEFNEATRERVHGALEAAIQHVEHKRDLQYGVQARHVGMALDYLKSRDYAGHRDLKPREQEFIEKTLKDHFGITEEAPEAEKKAA